MPRPLPHLLLVALCAPLAGAAPAGDGPDITVVRIAGDSSDYRYFGQSGGIAAYSFGTTSCNSGTEPVNWMPLGDHPVIGQNLFRLRDGLFEQIGQSWLKHGFCATNELHCGACQVTPCDTLGIGCADTYDSTLNDGRAGGPKWQVDPTTGVHTDPYPQPTGPTEIRGRLQVAVADIDPTLPENRDARWFAEGQYVSAHDHAAGNSANDASWQLVNVVSVQLLQSGGSTVVGQPAIHAWKLVDPEVHVAELVNPGEGGAGIDGHYWVASRAYDLGGSWRYVYAVQNLDSRQAGASLAVPVAEELAPGAYYFHDVDYHSGEPYDGSDWSAVHAAGLVTFACPETFQQNPDANALRWGTLYTFAFECDSPPQLAPGGELALFEPGVGTALQFSAYVPGGEPPVGVPYCFGDGTGAFCPCFNFGDAGHGCGNEAFGGGARLSATGTASVGADTVTLFATQASPSEPAVFFQGDARTAGGAGLGFGDGLRCAGTNVVRLETVVTDTAGGAQSSVSISAAAGLSPGDLKRYQLWYRDPLPSPCGQGFNLTGGIEIAWGP